MEKTDLFDNLRIIEEEMMKNAISLFSTASEEFENRKQNGMELEKKHIKIVLYWHGKSCYFDSFDKTVVSQIVNKNEIFRICGSGEGPLFRISYLNQIAKDFPSVILKLSIYNDIGFICFTPNYKYLENIYNTKNITLRKNRFTVI